MSAKSPFNEMRIELSSWEVVIKDQASCSAFAELPFLFFFQDAEDFAGEIEAINIFGIKNSEVHPDHDPHPTTGRMGWVLT